MPDSNESISYKIENLVACVKLNIEIDIRDMVWKLRRKYSGLERCKVEYKPKKFPGVIFKSEEPRYTSLIFSSGKAVLTGNKSVQGASDAFKDTLKVIKGVGYSPVNPEMEITNIVAAYDFDIDDKLDLEGIYYLSPPGCAIMYEPVMFPGAICRLDEPKSVILLFASGKGVCTGVKKEEDVYKSLEKLRKLLDI